MVVSEKNCSLKSNFFVSEEEMLINEFIHCVWWQSWKNVKQASRLYILSNVVRASRLYTLSNVIQASRLLLYGRQDVCSAFKTESDKLRPAFLIGPTV